MTNGYCYLERLLITALMIAVLALSPKTSAAFYLGAQTPQPSPSVAPSPEELPKQEQRDHDDTDDTDNGEKPSSCFVPWKQPLRIANGDYRNEAVLEDSSLPLYSKQQHLPRLPIPTLRDTMTRFLPSALPLAETSEERQTLLEACHEFPQQAEVLQQRLEQRRQEFSDSSWLQQYWQTQGYLQVRDPLAVMVSYFLFIPDDDTLAAVVDNKDKHQRGIARAAALLVAMATCRQQICSGTMSYETIGGAQPLCSTGFHYLFHTTRIPTSSKSQDVIHVYDPSQHSHCIVACKGQFFAVDFCDRATGGALPLSTLEQRLQHCRDMAAKATNHETTPEMGWLTSCNRDVWANARQELLDIGGTTMNKALTKLESGAFLLALDDDEPETLTDAAKLFWYGGDDNSGGNRWFDKSFQLVCTNDGRVGYVGEHSMLDAAPVLPLIRRIIKTPYKKLKQKEVPSLDGNDVDDERVEHDEGSSVDGGVTDVFAECWSSSPELTATALKLTSAAKEHHRKLTSNHELGIELFEGYGKKFIKSAGFVCHEYVQMAIQLAGYRLFGKQVATYEAALARTFLHGRTENARPVSPQSKAFVESMGLAPNDDRYSSEEKLALLKEAASKHEETQRLASIGMGVDRHFFGLSNMLREGEDAPSLFSHPLYHRSKHWRLSTSSVIFTPGFGPVVDDGLGVGFRVDAKSCMFVCTSRKENNYVQQFCELLDEALEEMGSLVKDE